VTPADRQSYDAQMDGWLRRAKRERGTVTHATWREGRLSCIITPNRDIPRPVEEQRTGMRGVQAQLL
jgi:hypothetical protein